MAVLNYTTSIAADRTQAEVQGMLARHGASQVMVDYVGGRATGVTFTIDTDLGAKLFSLPVDVDAMRALLIQQDRAGKLRSSKMSQAARTSLEHAERVAWRVVKDWLEAQLAIIETRMVKVDQVMLPYLVVDAKSHRSLYDEYREQGLLELTDGGESRG